MIGNNSVWDHEVLVKLKPRGVYRSTVVNLVTDEVTILPPIISRSIEGAKYHAANAAGIGKDEYDNYDILIEFSGYVREAKQ